MKKTLIVLLFVLAIKAVYAQDPVSNEAFTVVKTFQAPYIKDGKNGEKESLPSFYYKQRKNFNEINRKFSNWEMSWQVTNLMPDYKVVIVKCNKEVSVSDAAEYFKSQKLHLANTTDMALLWKYCRKEVCTDSSYDGAIYSPFSEVRNECNMPLIPYMVNIDYGKESNYYVLELTCQTDFIKDTYFIGLMYDPSLTKK